MDLRPDQVERVVTDGLQVESDRDGRRRYEGEVNEFVIRVVLAVDRADLVVTVYPRRK